MTVLLTFGPLPSADNPRAGLVAYVTGPTIPLTEVRTGPDGRASVALPVPTDPTAGYKYLIAWQNRGFPNPPSKRVLLRAADGPTVAYATLPAVAADPLPVSTAGGTGTTGGTGATGATGPAGPKGDPGPTGPAGPKGDTGAAGSDATVTDAAMAGALGPTTAAALAARAELKAAFAPVSLSRRIPGTRGKIVMIVDDARISQYNIAAPKIEAVGGKLNFAINWQNVGGPSLMTASQVTDLYNRGHQIMSHSMTHPNMTTQTAAQRQPEWDTSKVNLESITAVGAITDFVYPNNVSNLATTVEAYGRYARTFTGGGVVLIRPGDMGLTIPRGTWGSGTHQQVLTSIARIAVTGEVMALYCHDTAAAGVSDISPAMLDEAIAKAASVGVEWVRSDEVFPGYLPPFTDYSFESGDLTGLYNTVTSKGSGCTIDIVDDVPAAGLPGTKSLRMVNDGTGTLNRVSLTMAGQWLRPGVEYTLSGRIRQDKTSGTGGGQLIIRQWDEFGVNLGDTNTAPLNAAGTGVTPWTQVSVAFTPNKLSRGPQVWAAQSTMVGTTWFDHLHLGPTQLGVLG